MNPRGADPNLVEIASDGANDYRDGYKLSSVGVIPNDWTVAKLGLKVRFRTGPFGSALHKSDYTVDGVPVINPMHIADGSLFPTSTMTVSETAARGLADYRLAPGELIIGRRGEMGRVAVIRDEQRGWLCGTGSMIIRCSSDVDPGFLQLVLSSPRAIAEIEAASVGSTMINLNQDTLANLNVQLPSRPEQRAIAEALSDIDNLITALNALIAKKRAIKLATMQQLLTGKTRLPGFEEEWQRKRLGILGTFAKGRGIRKDDVAADGLPCVRYGEIYTHHNDYIRHFYSFVSRTVADQSYRLRKGDLLFAGSGETASEIGKCVAFLGPEEAYAGGDIVVFTPFAQDSMFLGYFLNRFSARDQMTRMGQGDAVVHISASNLATLELVLPLPDEQRAISQVLSDMDAEIEALQARVAKTRDIKQGVMQQLLSGRIRLVTPVTEEVPA